MQQPADQNGSTGIPPPYVAPPPAYNASAPPAYNANAPPTYDPMVNQPLGQPQAYASTEGQIQPVMTQPVKVRSQSVMTQPVRNPSSRRASAPVITEGQFQPVMTQPVMAQNAVAQPVMAQPVMTQNAVAQPVMPQNAWISLLWLRLFNQDC